MVLLNPEQFAAEEQRKNNNCFLSSLQPFITTLFFHTQDAPRGFILLRDLGLLPTACSFPKCLGRISLLLLFLQGSLPTPRGRPLPCDNSLLATQSLLGKIKSTCKDEACQSFLHTRESIISFFFLWTDLLIKKYKNKKMTQLAAQFQEYSQNSSDVVAKQWFSGHWPLPSDKATYKLLCITHSIYTSSITSVEVTACCKGNFVILTGLPAGPGSPADPGNPFLP